MSISGRTYSISAGEYEATIAEVGAGLQGLRHGGVDVTCAYGHNQLPPKGCGTTLVPWPNRIRGGRYTFDDVSNQLPITEPSTGNAIHGLGRWSRWELVSHETDSVTLRLDVVPQKGYVHEIGVVTSYRLTAEHGLSVTIEASNTGSSRAPFGAGSHPYLTTRGHRLDDVVVRLPAAAAIEVDDTLIPVRTSPVAETDYDLRTGAPLGARRFDHGFADVAREPDGLAEAEVSTPSGGARLWFDRSFDYLQVFTVEALLPGVAAVAIEPMSCAANAFNSGDGLVVLEPGQQWSGVWGIAAT